MSAPRIGGLSEWYLARQLRNFRQGIRGGSYDDMYGTQMRAMSLTLDHEDEIDELARYLSTLAPPAAESSIKGDLASGKKLYAVCSACHGADGNGNEQMNAPALKGQYDWYLMRQLDHFSNRLRGASKDDTFGQQMVPIMQTLPNKQAMEDLVAYISSL
jgi:cytochrome c oxidase subunit 2